MKNLIIVLLSFIPSLVWATDFFGMLGNLNKELESRGMHYQDVPSYTLVHNGRDYVCLDKGCPVSHLGVLEGKWVHQDGQCEIYLHFPSNYYPRTQYVDKPPFKDMILRMKTDFQWGAVKSGARPMDVDELRLLLHWLPNKTAKRIFRATRMATYPYNMHGSSCHGIERVRAVLVGKGDVNILIYFMFKGNAADNFEKYLQDMKGMITF